MSSTYNYSLSGDFSNGLRNDQLHFEIVSNIIITKTLEAINTHDDDVNIVFSSILTTSEKTELDNIISNHNPLPIVQFSPLTRIFSFIPLSIVSISYQTISTFLYNGVINEGAISKFILYAKGQNYNIRIRDDTNNLTIAEETFTNTSFSIIELTNISNLPIGQALFEIQVKKNNLLHANPEVKTIQIEH